MYNKHRVYWCLVKGDSIAFEITAPVDTISRLKVLVWEKRKNGVLRDIDPADLSALESAPNG